MLGYMATQPELLAVQNRGLLTADDRRFWLGEKDTEDADKVRREKRHNVNERIENIVKDLRILKDTDYDETDLINEFHAKTDRESQIEEELNELRQRLESDE